MKKMKDETKRQKCNLFSHLIVITLFITFFVKQDIFHIQQTHTDSHKISLTKTQTHTLSLLSRDQLYVVSLINHL